jgi:hypothetical protein
MWQPTGKVKGENTVISTVFSPGFGGLKNGGLAKMFVYRQRLLKEIRVMVLRWPVKNTAAILLE